MFKTSHTYQPHTFHNHFQKTHIAFKGISFIWMHCFTLCSLSRGMSLEKSTLWTKSYTQVKIFISTQTPEVIMALCKVSTALGTETPHQQPDRIKQTVSMYLGTVKVQTALNLTTWKNHSCQSCYPAFLLKQNKKKTKKPGSRESTWHKMKN